MTSKCKWFTGAAAGLALVASSVGCSNSGNKRAVADSSGSHYRTDNSMTGVSNQSNTTASVSPAPAHTYESNPYANSAYDTESPRRIVRVSATDPEIRGTTATATYDDGSPRSRVYSNSSPRSTLITQEEPPLLPPEQLPRTPGENEFWVSSHWRWDGNRYVLEQGHMERRRSNELYHPAKWTQTDQGWEFTPAYWD